MKKIIILTLLIFLSCSKSEDSVDEIIGYWFLTERYESNIQLDLHCDNPFELVFKENNEMVVNLLIQYLSDAEECMNIDATTYTWKKNDNQYEIYLSPDEIHSEVFINENKLTLNLRGFPNKYIFEKAFVLDL